MASDDNPENLTRAETALQELISSIDESPDHVFRITFAHKFADSPILRFIGKSWISTIKMDENSCFKETESWWWKPTIR